jgi:hypothetical protein
MTTILHTKAQGLRVHKLASLGGLVAIAGLEDIEPAVLLGAFLEMAQQFLNASTQQLETLRGMGLQKLRERNSEKRIYKQQKEADQTQTEFTLDMKDIKKIIIKLGGRIPVFEKDICPELLRLIR